MRTNLDLKAELIRRWGSQTASARALGLSESRLSRLIHGWSVPTAAEVETFSRVLGSEIASKLRQHQTNELEAV